jgi:hypothetical protein
LVLTLAARKCEGAVGEGGEEGVDGNKKPPAVLKNAGSECAAVDREARRVVGLRRRKEGAEEGGAGGDEAEGAEEEAVAEGALQEGGGGG